MKQQPNMVGAVPSFTAAAAQGASIPAPVEGWDAVSPIAAMSPKRAYRLDNWFPQQNWLELRKGYAVHSDTVTASPVETIAAYHGETSNRMFAAAGGTIFDVTPRAPSTVAVTGMGSNRFIHINFATTGGNFLYMVNGVNVPQYYNGMTWQSAAITGIAGDDIVSVTAFKNRLWFAMNDSTDAAYLDVDSIQGAATVFPLGGLFTLGGYLMAMATWTVDGGNGPDDYLVFMSSQGQVVVYHGIDPANDFQVVGTFNMGPPIGRRCFEKVGADVAIICIDGVIPLSKSLVYDRAASANIAVTQRIQRVMNESARAYKDNFGWQLISYPRGTRAILNVPIAESEEQQQYVMNTLSGAWCRFIGMNANCWGVFEDDLYFGGNDGVVYQADTGGTDYNGAMRADMMTSFNYFNGRGFQKRFTMCRPLLTTDQKVLPGIAFNTDFRTDAATSVQNTVQQAGALWDVALWDASVWGGQISTLAEWQSVTGIGYCASVRMVVDVQQPATSPDTLWGIGSWGLSIWGSPVADSAAITLQVNGFDLTYEGGGFI